MNTRKALLSIISFLAIFCLTIGIQGCSAGKKTIGGAESGLDPVPNYAEDFQDIEVPPEMDQDNGTSMIVKTESFRGGVIEYTGRVDPASLKEFMVSAMKNNTWKLVGEASYSDKMMVFSKPHQSCILVIKHYGLGKTRMIMHVAYDDAAIGDLNPFGESKK